MRSRRCARGRLRVTVAGRTDSGVHARGQVASHEGEPVEPARLNGAAARRRERAALRARARWLRRPPRRAAPHLPLPRARARGASPLERARALWWPRPVLDRGRCDACAAALPGTHDFTAFTPTQTDHVRFERDVIRAEWVEEASTCSRSGSRPTRFMRHMVRILVGTMLAVAGGRETREDFARLLTGRPRSEAADTAPPTASTSSRCGTEPGGRCAPPSPPLAGWRCRIGKEGVGLDAGFATPICSAGGVGERANEDG